MRSQPVFKAVLLGIAIGIMAVSQLRADDVYGRIRGTVTDPSGAIIPSVPVSARNVDTGITRTPIVSTDGNFELVNLAAPATYLVTAEEPGFKRYEMTGIKLALNQIYV